MPETSSVVLHAFVDEVRDLFPSVQVAKLKAHASEIAQCTAHHDHKRSRRCAAWAIDLVKAQAVDHPEWAKIKEEHKFWEDAWAGLEWFESPVLPGAPHVHTTPGHAIEVEWAQEAVDVAKRVASVSGWDAVDWEPLLVELIEMEDSPRRG